MEIVFSINNNAETMVLPVAPEWEIARAQSNDTFSGLSFHIRMIGNVELRSLSLQSFFPAHPYPFVSAYASSVPEDYIAFFSKVQEEKIPARIVIADKENKELLNMAVTIDQFTYTYRKNGDVDYQMDLTEYVFLSVGGA